VRSASTGDCGDEEHFHAWIRLPNPFQIRDITEKARAARARKKKELDDETSDARVTLEFDLQDLAATTKEVIVNEIVDKDFADDYRKAVREVDTQLDPDYAPKDEDDEIPKLWEHIDQDREEYERQRQHPGGAAQRRGVQACWRSAWRTTVAPSRPSWTRSRSRSVKP
jgi:hypothetical protein